MARTTVEKRTAERMSTEKQFKKVKIRLTERRKREREAIKNQDNALSWLPAFTQATFPDGILPRIRAFEHICRSAKYLSSDFSQTDVKQWLKMSGYVPDGPGFILKSVKSAGISKINPSKPKKDVASSRKKKETIAKINYDEHELMFSYDCIANLNLGKKITRRKSTMVEGRAIFGKADDERTTPTFGGNGNQYHHTYSNHLQPFIITYNNDGIYISHRLL